ncbi:MAG: PaaI family thioesterase [Candidatus Marinimicrobia bacterium]|nr:PaaI family thioesterase [Candidatus Neomarinimicrobiota bacterium]MCF7923368.1 PaaI family thioesterase [Candidatus Neomarinimicrobiota bacterium]
MINYKQLEKTVPIEFGKQFISFISGEHNDHRIRLKYHFHEESGEVFAEVTFGQLAQGPPGHAHGGAISAVFDELMGACCWVNSYPAMTAQYTTRFFKPLPLEKEVLYCAKIKMVDGHKISLKAKLIDETDKQYASARGLFIIQEMERFAQMNLDTGSKVAAFVHTHDYEKNRKGD